MLIRLGAIYVDAVTEVAAPGPRPRLINRVPQPAETGVRVAASIQFSLTDPGAAGLSPTTLVFVTAEATTVLAFDQSIPAFDPAYSSSIFSTVPSLGSGVPDQLFVRLVRSTPWTSEQTVSVRVVGATLDAVPFDETYTFTIEDVTAPGIEQVETRGLRKLLVRFSEPVQRATSFVGAADRVRDVSGGVVLIEPNIVELPVAGLTANDVGYVLGIARADHSVNNGFFTITNVIDSRRLEVTEVLQAEGPSSSIRAFLAPYRLQPVLDSSGLVPQFTSIVVAARAVPASELSMFDDERRFVELTLEQDLSAERTYELAPSAAIRDLVGNPIGPPFVPKSFLTEPHPTRQGRGFSVFDFIPDMNTREDTTGDLRRTLGSLDDVMFSLLADVDRFEELWDIDLTPENVVDVLLLHLGVPFSFAPNLSVADKRRLLDVLTRIYQLKGVEGNIEKAYLPGPGPFFSGMESVLQFFLNGIEFDVRPINEIGDVWELGESLLGLDTTLGLDAQFLLYSFEVFSPQTLTDDQRTRLIEVVEYMKPAHTHFLRILEPGPPLGSPIVFWLLDVGQIDLSSALESP